MRIQEAGSRSLPEAAVAYARSGLAVFPCWGIDSFGCGCGRPDCATPGKHPLAGAAASSDPAVVEGWWAEHPTANIGLACGQLIVVDLDPDEGPGAWAALEAELGIEARTAAVETGGGGRHLYYLAAEPVRAVLRRLGPGIEVHAEGHFVVAPPSAHPSGRLYRWLDDAPVADLPAPLATRITEPPPITVLEGGAAGSQVAYGPPPWWAACRRLGFSQIEVTAVAERAGVPIPVGVEVYRVGDAPLADVPGWHALAKLAALLRAVETPPLIITAAIDVAAERIEDAADRDRARHVAFKKAEEVGWHEDDPRWPEPDVHALVGAVAAQGTALDIKADPVLLAALCRLSSMDLKLACQALAKRGWKGSNILRQLVVNTVGQRPPDPLPAITEGAPFPGPDALVTESLPTAPVDGDPYVPDPWRLTTEGVWLITDRTLPDGHSRTYRELVTMAPIIVETRDHDEVSGQHHRTVAWLPRGHSNWSRCFVPASSVASKKRIVDLADLGLPANDENAKALVRWINAYETANALIIPERRVSRQIGWCGSKPRGFLYGAEWLSDEEGSEVVSVAEGGIAQMAAAMTPAGDAIAEREALTRAAAYPSVLCVMGAVLGAPLLRALGAPGFVLSLSGATSIGKTSALRVGGAILGAHDERQPNTVVHTWDATRAWLEVMASGLDGLPLLMDDTQRAKDKKAIAQALYDVPSGKARGRATVTAGTRPQPGSPTIMISTSEGPILDTSPAGGTRARVLELWGAPWGEVSAETAAAIREILWVLADNHGHTGRAWVGMIIASRSDWPTWRARYRAGAKNLAERMGRGQSSQAAAVLGRLAEYISVIALALDLAMERGVLPGLTATHRTAALRTLATDAASEATRRDAPAEALGLVVETALSQRAALYDVDGSDQRQPHAGWIGRWDSREADFLYLTRTWIDHLLRDADYSTEAVLRQWRERGWLGASKPLRVEGAVLRLQPISIDAVAPVLGYDPRVRRDPQLPMGGI